MGAVVRALRALGAPWLGAAGALSASATALGRIEQVSAPRKVAFEIRPGSRLRGTSARQAGQFSFFDGRGDRTAFVGSARWVLARRSSGSFVRGPHQGRRAHNWVEAARTSDGDPRCPRVPPASPLPHARARAVPAKSGAGAAHALGGRLFTRASAPWARAAAHWGVPAVHEAWLLRRPRRNASVFCMARHYILRIHFVSKLSKWSRAGRGAPGLPLRERQFRGDDLRGIFEMDAQNLARGVWNGRCSPGFRESNGAKQAGAR